MKEVEIQEFVVNCLEFVNDTGGFWEREKVLLQLMEECGELAQSCRKGTVGDISEEAGDVLFVILCFLYGQEIDQAVFRRRIRKNNELRRVYKHGEKL